MKKTDDWRIKALGDGLAVAPALFDRYRSEVLGTITDPYTRLVASMAVQGSLRHLYPILYGVDTPTLDTVVKPLVEQLRAFHRWLGGELGVLHISVVKRLGPPPGIAKATALIGSELFATAKGYPDPGPFWTGALLGFVVETFAEAGLQKPEVHACADADDMRAAIVELQMTGEIVDAGISLKPTQQ